MTREEKINTLKAIIQECEEYQWQRRETLFEIIKDLEQEPTTKNNLAVDKLISDCEKMSFDIDFFNKPLKVIALDAVKNIVNDLPTVTPQEPTCKECAYWKDSDGVYRRGVEAEKENLCPINTHTVYCGEGYCYMFSPKADIREEEE